MALELLLGGARSGKSALAVRRAAASGRPVVFVATGEARDAEMAERIARHRAERPPGWRTVEEPLALEAAVAGAPREACLVVDCLSLWVANALERGDGDAEVEGAAARAAALAARRPGPGVVVSNEVGLGLVPMEPLGRRYRDVLGRVNATWARAADRAALVVAGRVLALERPEAW
jgi:adenosyl cobinamide kinase/adenosyl cobinamide phosphate guanylyltransferase